MGFATTTTLKQNYQKIIFELSCGAEPLSKQAKSGVQPSRTSLKTLILSFNTKLFLLTLIPPLLTENCNYFLNFLQLEEC